MKELFAQIESAVNSCTGWCPIDKACTLASMVIALRPDVTVEIGVWGGRSLLPMALAHKHLGQGMVIGIDPWMASVSAELETGKDKDWWGSQNHEAVFQDFMRRVNELSVNNVVRIHRMKSDDFDPPNKIGLLHVDGCHMEQAVRDVMRYSPHVVRGGFCVMDDEGWHHGWVGKAVQKLLQFGFVKRYPLGTGGCYQKIS